jgi:hypothetical protein
MEDNTTVSVCIGTFDPTGIPITITRHLSDCATVAFQAITLNLLLAQAFNLEPAETVEIHHEDGSGLRINRTLKGFIGYAGTYSGNS